MRNRRLSILPHVFLICAVLALVAVACAAAYQTDCYFEAGGSKIICNDGGEAEFQTGSLIDIQAGATFSVSSNQDNSGWVKVAAPTTIATATPAVVIDSLGLSSLLEVRDAVTPVFSVYNGGEIDIHGNQLDLDEDNDTSITVDTDDQIDVEIAGGDVAVMKAWPIADQTSTTNLLELIDTSPVDTTGTQTHNALVIDLGIGASTGGTNIVTALQIDGITGDNNVTENAINIGAGWLVDLNGATDLIIAVDAVAVATVKDPAGADSATTTALLEIAGTSPVDTTGTNVHEFITIDVAVGDSSAGTNAVTALQIDGISGDAEVTETAINLGSGWDVGINSPQDQENIGVMTIASEAITWESSGAIWTIADGEVWIVHRILLDVGTNFDADGDATVIVGDSGDTDGLLALVDAEIQTNAAEATGMAAGWGGQLTGTQGAYLAGGMMVYAPTGAAETIDIVCAGTNLAAGAGTLYIVYTRIQ